jgi:hypothetical protein
MSPELFCTIFYAISTLVIVGFAIPVIIRQGGISCAIGLAVLLGLVLMQGSFVLSVDEKKSLAVVIAALAVAIWFSPGTGRESLPFD